MDLDKLIREDLVQFRERVIEAVQKDHPHIFAVIDKLISDKENKIGMQVLENNQVAGEYTFNLKGIHVTSVDSGKMISELHHPMLGIVKPYVIIERSQIEKIINDQEFFRNLLSAVPKYLPEMTIKFMR